MEVRIDVTGEGQRREARFLDVDAELLVCDLGERGLEPLAVTLDAGQENERPVGFAANAMKSSCSKTSKPTIAKLPSTNYKRSSIDENTQS